MHDPTLNQRDNNQKQALLGQLSNFNYELYIRKQHFIGVKISDIDMYYGYLKECPCSQEIQLKYFRVRGMMAADNFQIGERENGK